MIALAHLEVSPCGFATDTDRDDVRGQAVPRAQERLAARGLLRCLLGDVAGPAAAAAPIDADPDGKPFLRTCPGVGISISHSDGWVAAAVVRDGRLGVDVQAPMPASPGLLARCLSGADFAAVRALAPGEQARHLAWVWSVQEACVKATGGGFKARPWSIPVGLHDRSGRWGRLAWTRLPSLAPVALSVAKLRGVPS